MGENTIIISQNRIVNIVLNDLNYNLRYTFTAVIKIITLCNKELG